MSRPGTEVPSPRVQRQADRWLLRIKTGQATAREVQLLRQWCAARPAHARAFEQSRRDWVELGDVGEACRASAVRAAPPAPARRWFLGSGLAFAGTAAVAAVVQPPLGLWPSWSEWQADYRTAAGERRRVTLAPDLAVELNTRTSVGHRSRAGREELDLIGGEVVVSSGHADSGVDLVADGVRIAVHDGEVQVARSAAGVCVTCLRGAADVVHPAGAVRLEPHEQVRCDAAGIGPVRVVDAARLTAWREGALVFRETPLAEAVEEINRYRAGRVVVLGDTLAARQVSGRFQIARLDEVIDQIESALGARVRRMPGGVVVLS
jgi:transmembrane sensor